MHILVPFHASLPQVRRIASEENREFIFRKDVPHTGRGTGGGGAAGGRGSGRGADGRTLGGSGDGRKASQASTHNAAAISGVLAATAEAARRPLPGGLGGTVQKGKLPAIATRLGLAHFDGAFAPLVKVEVAEVAVKEEGR